MEGYYVPGKIDNTNGEEIINGSPIIPPVGQNTIEDLKDPLSLGSLMQLTRQVEDTYDADRTVSSSGSCSRGWR